MEKRKYVNPYNNYFTDYYKDFNIAINLLQTDKSSTIERLIKNIIDVEPSMKKN